MRIHLAFAFYILLAAAVTGASRAEWAVVLLCIGAVTSAELINTALEKVCDRFCPEHSADVGLIKDMAAAAVLVFGLVSAVVGGIIFFNAEKVGATIAFFSRYPVFAIVIVATLPVAIYLVFRKYK